MTSSLDGLTTCTGTATQDRRLSEAPPTLGATVADNGAATARWSAEEAFRVSVVAITTSPSADCCRTLSGCPSTTEGPSPYVPAGAAADLAVAFALGLAVGAALGCAAADFGFA